MTRSIRWRIIVLQIVALLVLAFGSGAGFVANSFTITQIHDQLAPQQIYFPANAAQGLPKDLNQYAGQQVLTGEQAHAYAEQYIAVHLSEIGQGHPYSYWSAQARTATDPTVAAKDQGIADTLFKGETLRSMLNQAWTFSVIAQLALIAGIAFALAAVVVLGTLIFEVAELVTGRETVETVRPTTVTEPNLAGVQ
ncbi:MAG TPA: hypothetical protein VFS83_14335 [Ktedonobacterales bacterium]|nr:hypothetical protein [Ktedonobacterales bacterium]